MMLSTVSNSRMNQSLAQLEARSGVQSRTGQQKSFLLTLIFLLSALTSPLRASEDLPHNDLLSKKQLREVIELTKGHELYFLTKKLDHKVATLILYANKSESVLPLRDQDKKSSWGFSLKVALGVALLAANVYLLRDNIDSFPFWYFSPESLAVYRETLSRDYATLRMGAYPAHYGIEFPGGARDYRVQGPLHLIGLHLLGSKQAIIESASFLAANVALGYYVYVILKDLFKPQKKQGYRLSTEGFKEREQTAGALASEINQRVDDRLWDTEDFDIVQMELVSRDYIHAVAKTLQERDGFESQRVEMAEELAPSPKKQRL